jgi:L-cysteine/cystine lyase
MPVRAIADLAHARGALLIVDGAQAAGAIPVDLTALGADAYAIPGQKWLLGPEGTGALAVVPAARERIRPSAAGYFAFERVDSLGDATFWTTGRRYEGSSFSRVNVIGLARSIGWLSMFVGLPWLYERGATMARLAWERLAAIDGVEMVSPREPLATLVSFRIRGWPAQDAMDELGSRAFAILRVVALVDALRISVGWFTTDEELERLATVVELLAAHTPETLPPRRTLTILGEA